jgi:hypothetical protein
MSVPRGIDTMNKPVTPRASAPRNGGEMFTYRLHLEDGSEVGEATYTQMIHVGEEIIADKNQRFRVIDVVVFEEEDESQFVGLPKVEAV